MLLVWGFHGGGGGEGGEGEGGGTEHFPGFRFPLDGSAFYTVKKPM
jgi:hypothetical protein